MNGSRLGHATLVLLTALGTGCFTPRTTFRPVTPVRATAAPVVVELEGLGRGVGVWQPPSDIGATNGTTVTLRWRAPDGVGLARAALAPRSSEPCRGGVESVVVAADGQARWDRPVGLDGEHHLMISFPDAPGLITGESALDLEVSGGAGPSSCVRLPLTGPAQKYETASPMAAEWSLESLAPLRSQPILELRGDVALGRWLGPVRLLLHVGLGYGRRLDVGASDTGVGDTLFMVHAAPELTWFATTRSRLALGISAGFEVAAGGGDGPRRDETYAGPRVGLTIGSTMARPPGLPEHRPLGGRGLELFLLRASWPDGSGRGAAYVLGVGFAGW